MASRYASSSGDDGVAVVGNPTYSSGSSSQSSVSNSSSSSESFTGIQDEEALIVLKNLIKQLAGGGTDQQRATNQERQQTIQDTRATAQDYTKDKAFTDAKDLITQSLQTSMEKQMPAISKSIQGAGTSSSSMQGLLSQKLATDASTAAGALGAEQAKAYGNISANLASVLERLTQNDSTTENSLINALALLRNTTSSSESSSSSVSSGSSNQSSSGGGSRLVSTSTGNDVSNNSNTQSKDPVDDSSLDSSYDDYITYVVYETPGAFADYTGDVGYTSNDFPSGYMSITNTTDYSGSSGDYYSDSSSDDYYSDYYSDYWY